jgi:hypothetical protein
MIHMDIPKNETLWGYIIADLNYSVNHLIFTSRNVIYLLSSFE